MKKSIYFANEAQKVNEVTFNANGFGEEFADGDDFAFGDGYADGGSLNDEQESMPYIITAENTTTTDIANVELLKAVSRQSSFAVSGVSFGMKANGVTYQEFLQWIATGNTFLVGRTSLVADGTSSSNNLAQVQEIVTVETREPSGSGAFIQLNPRLDRMQNQNNITELVGKFYVKPFTSMKISALKASTKLSVYLYPKAVFDSSRAMKTGAAKDFKKPRIA